MILCDTNILVEAQRGNIQMVNNIERLEYSEYLVISDVTCIELYFGARNKVELQCISKDLTTWDVVPVSFEISNKAVALVKQFALSHRLNLPDALIAATAIIYDMGLYTLNVKDFAYLPINLYTP
jgi:predicted nucleic acid-binding protein